MKGGFRMQSVDQQFANTRADEFRRADAELRATCDLMSYLSLEECAIVTEKMHRQFMLKLGRRESRLQ
jgi:hypothetical protein